ncbi:MAG TPA: 3,4-dihydroxy-2-butanone-4-phosphate synthase [Polyangiaceae bacterium]|nr:3,4-dihydroxy-2-butanone-4-phosphate synthase [Polyangiaceae bacterium]
MSLGRVSAALAALRRGEFVVVADDHDRENEGDLILPALSMTPAKLAFLLRHTSGVVCVAITRNRAQALALPLMVKQNEESQRTQFTVSVDARGTGTGISAGARSHTIVALAHPESEPSTFLRPGHVFPLIARAGGVLERRGHTEAAVDLMRLAGLEPAGALCELMAEDGSMLSGAALERFARTHGLPFLHIADLVSYRRAVERAPVAPRAAEACAGSAP